MSKFITIILFSTFWCTLHAQEFVVTTPKQKRNDFAKSFVFVLNSSSNYFKNIQDKPIKGLDSIFTDAPVFYNKVKLKGSVYGRIVHDSIPYAAYYFGTYPNLEAVEATYINLSNLIAESLGGKVLFKSIDGNKNTPWLKQTKIAYTQNTGFFMFNIFVELQQNEIDSSINLLLKIKGGSPQFFYKIARNEPIKSFMFASAFKSQLPAFQKRKPQGCLGDIPTFVCRGTRKQGDTTVVIYDKYGFTDLPDAKKEFEATLSNMRVSLTDDYVYFLPPFESNKLREVYFLKFDDIDTAKPKMINLTLVQKTKEDYILELGFVYR